MHKPAAPPRAVQVAVLGAPGTGKTQLAGELTAVLQASPAPPPALVMVDNPSLATVVQASASKLASQRFHHVLLMGLDLPASHIRLAEQEAADQRLRQALHEAGLAYTVVYGVGPARLANACSALQALRPPSPGTARSPWVWACDTCSDPACERRLLSDLLAGRSA